MRNPIVNAPAVPASAIGRAVVETLEQRRLLAFSGPNFDLPFVNDFSAERNGIEDKDGQTTGFPIVQGNTAADEYQADLIDLDLGEGLLLLTSRGNAANGGNFGSDNTLANGLQLPFDASEGNWTIHARISDFTGPFTQFDEAFEQAGILFGPTQDNFAKLVFGFDGANRVVQFVVETFEDGDFAYPAGQDGFKSTVTAVQGVNLGTADYIDLWLSGDPGTGQLSAQYRVEGGQTFRFEDTITLTGEARNSFFRASGARAGMIVQHKNDEAPITVAFDEFGVTRNALPSDRPAVESARPGPNEFDVPRDTFFAVDLQLPNAGIRESTLTSSTVKLTRVDDGKPVPARVNTTGGGDAIILTPERVLDADTEYRFEITSGVTDLFDVPFVPYSQIIRTGLGLEQAAGNVAFDQVALSDTTGELWTGVHIGPDNRLYATTVEGLIARWTINADGMLSGRQDINSITAAEGEQRVITGLTFAPDATAGNLVAYVTHTDFNDVTSANPSDQGVDFTGKVTRLSGANLETVQDVVVGLPRSIRDHLTNQPSFGPDGRLYVPQGANSAMGEPDPAWGFRPERLLTASILAIDVDAIGSTPVNVHTEDSDPYDPFASGAPVRLYATGVRNAYDMVWHSNGRLYVPTNGSAAGGNTPESPQPGTAEFGNDRVDLDINGPFSGDFVPGLDNVPQTQNDWLFDVEAGGYYGHPNPTRDEWVLNGGNPTGGADPAEVTAYPSGTQPDRNWRGAAYDFGKNISPNGAVEYTAETFDGSLKNKLIVTRFSGGDDLVVIELDAQGRVFDVREGVTGLGGFDDPLDVAQGGDGSLYVAEFGGQRITLLRPIEAGGKAKVENRRIFVNAENGQSADARFVVRNTGGAPLVLSGRTLTLTGPDRLLFDVDEETTQSVTVEPGDTHTFNVRFNAPSSATPGQVFNAAISVRTSDETAPEVTSRVAGMVTTGEGGLNEPSLQRILNLYGFGVDTGDDDETTVDISPGGALLEAPLFRLADPERPMIMVPIASFGLEADPAASVGIYPAGKPTDLFRLQDISSVQQVNPAYEGAVKFDPTLLAGETFGLYMQTPTFLDNGRSRVVYSEDAFNTWEPTAGERQKVFTYPLTLSDGTPLADSYVVGFEEFQNATDANDVVMIVRNVAPVAEDGARLVLSSPLQVPYSNALVFSQIDPAGLEPGQQVRSTQTVTVTNVGDQPIALDSASASGLFTVSGFAATTLAAGDSTTFTVNFDADAGDLNTGELNRNFTGTLTVATTGGAADLSMPLAGLLQRYSEDGRNVGVSPPVNAEGTLAQAVSLFGFDIDTGAADELDNQGIFQAVGEEVLSPFWRASGANQPIEVLQLSAYHLLPVEDVFRWYNVAAPGTNNNVFANEGQWAQSVLPALNDAGAGTLAGGVFTPGTATFGIRVGNEDSNHEENFVDQNDQGHHLRFFPLRDANGNHVQDTWLMTMDFIGFNFDYNDNVYIIRGMQPASESVGRSLPPTGAAGHRAPNGDVVLDWGADAEVDAFTVYRSVGNRDSFTKIHKGIIGSDYFIDGAPPAGEVYYRIFGVTDDREGMFSEVRIA